MFIFYANTASYSDIIKATVACEVFIYRICSSTPSATTKFGVQQIARFLALILLVASSLETRFSNHISCFNSS